ncbi:Hypothetical protein, putative [Bodo saltans]|uniref:THIF-type NAD/FAD binding fold domain-containing protein n=1 Tax=Bodo saltans TaxID=75058 RepID=A0A0S4JRQ2_BODSA|nr:Hypothetical protein, putative [Bodo saltans]|eukprot:CUG92064.1 Hypothetical protein, putative [Bodo saltans]
MTASSTTTPVSFQEQKFDRQLRLWGSDGQTSIERAHVVLLGVTSVGCEVLKNMILPNLGSFSVVDNATVQQSHLGSNFFLNPEDLGSTIAPSAVRGLSELNSASQGLSFIEDPNVWARETLLTKKKADNSAEDNWAVADALLPKLPGASLILLCTSRVDEATFVDLSRAVENTNRTLPTTLKQVLKNMILPNLGSFSVVDNATVQQIHLGSNFFLNPEDLGSTIAPSAVRGLSELNSASQGLSFIEDPNVWARETLLTKKKADNSAEDNWAVADALLPKLPGASLILLCTSRVDEATFVDLSRAVENTNRTLPTTLKHGTSTKSTRAEEANSASFLPLHARCVLVRVDVCGLVGVVRVQAGPPSRFVVHTHPDPETVVRDLGSLTPFPALKEWFDAHDPTDDNKYGSEEQWGEHGHIPWPCIVYHALRLQRQELGDELWVPKVSKDYSTLRNVITNKIIRRKVPPQESLMQALHECTLTLDVSRRLHRDLAQLLQDPRAVNGPDSVRDELYWFYLHALVVFRQRHDGAMPLSGAVPDMASTPEWFVELQGIYRAEADANAHEIFEIVNARLHDVLAKNSSSECSASDDTTSSWAAWAACGGKTVEALMQLAREVCRNVWTLSLVTFSNIAEELDHHRAVSIVGGSSSDGGAATAWYRVWRASLTFRQLHNGRHPGESVAAAAAGGGGGLQPSSQNEEEDGADDDELVTTTSRLEFLSAAQQDSDVAELRRIVSAQQQQQSNSSGGEASNDGSKEEEDSIERCAREYVRYGGGEINAVASIVGAVAAQESIKLLQQRRVPVADALVFDGNAVCGFATIRIKGN